MIRPTRSAALLLAFSLLTSATIASAECAWLLRNGAISINHWQIQGVHQTAAECNQDLISLAREYDKSGYQVRRQPGTSMYKKRRARISALPPRHHGPARAEGEVTVTRSQREARERRGGRTCAQPDLWRSVMTSQRRRSTWRRSGVTGL